MKAPSKKAKQADPQAAAEKQLEREVRASLIKFQNATGIKVGSVEIGIGALYALSITIRERPPKK